MNVPRSEENEGEGAVIRKGSVASLAPSSGEKAEGSVGCELYVAAAALAFCILYCKFIFPSICGKPNCPSD